VRLLVYLSSVVLFLALVGAVVLLGVLWHFSRDLPDYAQLADYRPPVTTRVHAGDGSLLAEFARERRLFVPVAAMPAPVVQAFLSAEDKDFFHHPGIDFTGIVGAAVQNLNNLGTDRRPRGASTITQQVAKNFLLSNEVSYERKIKEAILAFRLERRLSKEHILELYLNEIYLGYASYGVAAAALNYYGKALEELTVAEAAFLAALPKAPNNYHPIRFAEAAKVRRDWVLTRMQEDGVLSAAAAESAARTPLPTRTVEMSRANQADFFAEEVRRQLLERYGEAALYQGGLSVRSSLDPRLQAIAELALRDGLVAYDRRHGWRGPLARIETAGDWRARLARLPAPAGLSPWVLAVVLKVDDAEARIGLSDGDLGVIALSELQWARAWQEGETLGARVARAADVLAPGYVVAVEPLPAASGGAGTGFALRQIPEINGAAVAMDPHTGRVLAMVGGWSFQQSQYNRATQARRQPGSAFKPFVYAAALDHGFTPASLVLDAPFVFDPGYGQQKWRPTNYSHEFYGPSTLRLGIEKSRNLMTVRLAQQIGMDKVADYARRFGIVDNLQPFLPTSLGSGETTLLRLTAGYAMLVNGGRAIQPSLIDRIQDRDGQTVLRTDRRACGACAGLAWSGQPPPNLPDERAHVIDAGTAYQMVSMLQGAVERGTGARIGELRRPLAGKTGTTNEARDAWFVGFSPDLAFGVYLGFDEPRGLGSRETGASVAVPVFKDFMAAALKDQPAVPFRIPPGIRLVRVDPKTGLPALPGQRNAILEAFKPGTEPGKRRDVLDGSDDDEDDEAAAETGPGTLDNAAIPATRPAAIEVPRGATGGLY